MLRQQLEAFSKEQLIQMLLSKSTPSKKLKRSATQRLMNFEEYPMGKVAFKLFYLGHLYQGLATQIGFSDNPRDGLEYNTIEDRLLQVMEELRLIKSRSECEYSRCGRTDSGVSAIAQVISLKVRLSGSKNSLENEMIDFVKVLNKKFPEDIRILDWCFVPENFNARFSCTSRQYHYFFNNRGLDLSAMQSAAFALVGEHDFFNLHVIDSSKPAGYSTVRTMLSAAIKVVREDFFALVIRANGFLYHQIRCIMSVLLSIGRKELPPHYITELLTGEHKTNAFGSLNIPLADPHPLVFSDASYDNHKLSWESKIDSEVTLSPLYETQTIKSFITNPSTFSSIK